MPGAVASLIIQVMEITVARLGAFLLILALMLAWEQAAPYRRPADWPRRLHNLVLAGLSAGLLRLLPAISAVAAAEYAARTQFGLSYFLGLNPWVAGVGAFILLDLLIYAQHVAFHHISWLWPLHRVHHSDTDLDTTTGARFHPVEIAISMCVKFVAVLILGAPLMAVIVFEIVLNATSMFNHGNVRLPARVDHVLRRLIVTPAMHRVHHSTCYNDHNRNFGFNFSLWDRIFGTYRPVETPGYAIGLAAYRTARWRNSLWLLAQPFLPGQGRS